LTSCTFTAAPGTYVGVQLSFDGIYQVVINDPVNGIFTDAGAPNLLSTTAPTGNAGTIEMDLSNMGGTNVVMFPEPLELKENDTPTLSVIFDPIHWFNTKVSSGAFTEKLGAAGGPPVLAILGPAARVMFLSSGTPNSGGGLLSPPTAGNIQTGNGGMTDVTVIFSDAKTPVFEGGGGLLCPHPNGAWGSAEAATPTICTDPNDSNCSEVGGYLGLDPNNVLSWAFPDAHPSGGADYSTYQSLLQMPLPTTIGNTTTLSYVCSTTVPSPSGGANVYTTAPNLTDFATSIGGAVQTLSLTLLAD
jgi:hypothetical protein